ncbi:hypothetical protein YC2023_027287 [Brassica napus]
MSHNGFRYCPGCKEHRQAIKKLDLWRLPEILVIHLKRFSYSRFMKNKLEAFVDFPIDGLDLSSYISYKNGQTTYRYMLYAISNHYGEYDDIKPCVFNCYVASLHISSRVNFLDLLPCDIIYIFDSNFLTNVNIDHRETLRVDYLPLLLNRLMSPLQTLPKELEARVQERQLIEAAKPQKLGRRRQNEAPVPRERDEKPKTLYRTQKANTFLNYMNKHLLPPIISGFDCKINSIYNLRL